jgi:hypothetical protein
MLTNMMLLVFQTVTIQGIGKELSCFYLQKSHCFLLVQFKEAEETAVKLDLDGLVVIGGDDSNTNACLLAEYFR